VDVLKALLAYFVSQTCDYSNVVATPHIAGITSDSLVDIATGVTQNLERLLAGALLIGAT